MYNTADRTVRSPHRKEALKGTCVSGYRLEAQTKSDQDRLIESVHSSRIEVYVLDSVMEPSHDAVKKMSDWNKTLTPGPCSNRCPTPLVRPLGHTH